MITLIYLVLALVFGYTIMRWFELSFAPIEAAAISIITGLFGFTWIMFIACLALPYRWALPLGCLATLIISLTLVRHAHPARYHRLPRGTQFIWALIAIATMVFWATLMFGHDLNPVAGTLMSAGSTWADFGVHASIASHQAMATKLPLDLSVASGTHLTYPFLVDFLSALFLRGGWTLQLALAIPGTLLAWAITQLIISFGWRLYGRFGGGVVGLVLTLTGGSAAGLGVAWSDWRSSHLSLISWLAHVPQDYTGIDSLNVHFNNAVADLLLPQRPFLFGLGVWLTVAILWHGALVHRRRRWLYTGAVMVGLLPLAHAHSFVAAGVMLAGLVIWVAVKDREHLRPWLVACGIIAVLALPQVAWQELGTAAGGTGAHLISGWDRNPGQPLSSFEWQNFGYLLVVLVALTAAVLTKRWRHYAPWLLPFSALFIAAQLYSLQPFAYDNLKLLFYVYLMAMLALGSAIWYCRPVWRWLFIAVSLVAFSVPGTLSIIREYQLHYTFASADDLALATWAEANTPTTTVFAGTDIPNEPLATIAGRQIVLGYRGWLYSYHLDYSHRQAAVADLLAGDTTAPDVSLYHPNYLAVNYSDAATWTVDPAALSKLPLAYHNASWSVYRLP